MYAVIDTNAEHDRADEGGHDVEGAKQDGCGTVDPDEANDQRSHDEHDGAGTTEMNTEEDDDE